MAARMYLYVVVALAVAVVVLLLLREDRALETGVHVAPASLKQPPSGRRPLAEGCKHVYVDVGTNRGVQLRKLFQPEHYAGAKVLPVFDRFFGTDRATRSDVCAFGFEPNPSHTTWLKRIERAYRKHGWHVTIFSETAVGVRDGETVPFYFTGNLFYDLSASQMQNDILTWGGRRAPKRYDVQTMDLARFLLEEVFARSEATAPGAAVVMKLDIEGGELDLLPELLLRGALCNVDLLFAEFHERQFAEDKRAAEYRALEKLTRTHWWGDLEHLAPNANTQCRLKVSALDDETYRYDDGRSFLRGSQAAKQGFQRRTPPLPGDDVPEAWKVMKAVDDHSDAAGGSSSGTSMVATPPAPGNDDSTASADGDAAPSSGERRG